MAFDPSLCSLEEARTFCQAAGNTQDDLLRALILGATEVAEALGRENLKQRTYAASGDAPAVVLSGRGKSDLRVPYWPVASVQGIEFLNGDGETWDPVDLNLYPVSIDDEYENRIFFRNAFFPCGRQNVRVSMTAGYDPIPGRLTLAVRAIVLAGWKLRDKQIAMVASRTFEGQTVVYRDEDIPKLAKLYLAAFANQEIHV